MAGPGFGPKTVFLNRKSLLNIKLGVGLFNG
jgi:hypothetical protein